MRLGGSLALPEPQAANEIKEISSPNVFMINEK
jgi:hypothetical protein